MPASETSLYPLFLKLAGRRVLVVGAGSVAERKIAALLDGAAAVRVVAPIATPEIRRLAQEGAITYVERRFEESDLDGTWLVVAATGDEQVEARVAAAAEARRTFVIAVDDPGNATAYSAAVVRRPPFTMAISSSGAAPALTRLVREIVEHVLPPEEWVEHAQALRAKWIAAGTPHDERFAELVRALATRAKRG